MSLKHSNRFIIAMMLAVSIFACENNPQKADIQKPEIPSLQTVVNVTGGTVEGIEQDGIFSYRGVPFAAPPVADLRWKAPQPVVPWEGVKKADAFAPGPMQDTSFGAALGGPQEVSEDCLYLNVWTGAEKINEKRPVMVWIYGGGFGIGMTSTPAYDGTALAKKGVVLVSVAYRVGPMGFMAHPDLTAETGHGSGAYGIQDMIAGLEWVRDNISKFGGDPSNVTIFGESAGGYAVCMLTASPMAKGLFHRAISESGGGLAPPRMTLEQAETHGRAYLEELGVKTVAEARALSAEEIQKNTEGMGTFWPAPDNVTIPEDIYELYRSGKFNDTPILVGTNSNEGGLFVTEPVNSKEFENLVRSEYPENADGILNVYPHATDEEAFQSAKDLMRETSFAWPTWAWASLHSTNSNYKAFVYYFDHRTQFSLNGANHAAEISYVFGNPGSMGPMGGDSDEDKALSELISSYWINFAEKGDPNGSGLPHWPAFDKEQKVMYIDGKTGPIEHPDMDKIMAFDVYFEALRKENDK